MTSARKPLAVIVVGHQRVVAAGVQTLLAAYPRRVCATVRSADDLDGEPDLVSGAAVVMVAATGISAQQDVLVGRLLRAAPKVPVVILGDADDEVALLAALRHGVAGYLLTDMTDEEVVAALERVAAGQMVIAPTIAARLAVQLAHGPQLSRATLDGFHLRTRELQVLELLVEGRTNREIAKQLVLGEETVKTYLRQLYRKLGARDRLQAVAIATGAR